jgi:hypothetical protein
MTTPITPEMLVKQVAVVKQILAWDETSRHEPSFNFKYALHYFMEGVVAANPILIPGLSIALKTAAQTATVWNSSELSEMADILGQFTQKAP